MQLFSTPIRLGLILLIGCATTPKAADVITPEVYWGKHTNLKPELKRKVIEVANSLEIDPSHLLTVIAIETSTVQNGNPAPTFDPAIQNPGSTAVGLIQFTAATAEVLGTSTAKLKAMNAVDQMAYVEKYLLKHKGKLSTVEDVYLAVFYPPFIGVADTEILPVKFYEPNKALDKDGDGKITRAEIVAYVRKRHDIGATLKG